MRKTWIIGFLFFLLIMLIGGADWALHSTWLSANLVRRAIPNILPGAHVTELTAVKQQFFWPGKFVWSNVKFGLEYKGRTCSVVAPQVVVSGAESLFDDAALLRISLVDADILSPPVEARYVKFDLSASFEWHKLVLIAGPIWIYSIKWDNLVAEKVACSFSRKLGTILLDNIRARVYGGAIIGEARIDSGDLAYSASLKAEGIDTTKLTAISEQFASQVVGRAAGLVRVTGRAGKVSTLESSWTMREGTRVNAGLISVLTPVPVTQYIPQSPEKARLETLIKNGGQLSVEVLDFKVKSLTPQLLDAELKIKSREVNLEYNTSYDIKMDGTWLSLLDAWKELFKQRI